MECALTLAVFIPLTPTLSPNEGEGATTAFLLPLGEKDRMRGLVAK
jgi:hypothetical protein